jgi:hypothetical protein
LVEPCRRRVDDLVRLSPPRIDDSDSSGVEDDAAPVAPLHAITDECLTLDGVTLTTDVQPTAAEVVESKGDDLGPTRTSHGGKTQAERGSVVLRIAATHASTRNGSRSTRRTEPIAAVMTRQPRVVTSRRRLPVELLRLVPQPEDVGDGGTNRRGRRPAELGLPRRDLLPHVLLAATEFLPTWRPLWPPEVGGSHTRAKNTPGCRSVIEMIRRTTRSAVR